MPRQARHRVAVLLLDGAVPLDAAIPAQVFGRREVTPYELTMCGLTPGGVRADPDFVPGFGFTVPRGLEALDDADTVIVPGFEPALRTLEPEVLDALRAAASRGTRVASICTGAFALAQAGLLDGRRATTHWQSTDDLARLYPRVEVDRDVLFVDTGAILTSAGVAAGVDLCLHLVRRDLGVTTANAIARAMVAAPYRIGGQAQYVARALPERDSDVFAATRTWALTRLDDRVTVADMARHAAVSYRTFTRRFADATGHTPLQWLLRARLDLARELLETTDLGVDQIAARVGLGTGTNLRGHFQRVLRTTPTAYRRTFAA